MNVPKFNKIQSIQLVKTACLSTALAASTVAYIHIALKAFGPLPLQPVQENQGSKTSLLRLENGAALMFNPLKAKEVLKQMDHSPQ